MKDQSVWKIVVQTVQTRFSRFLTFFTGFPNTHVHPSEPTAEVLAPKRPKPRPSPEPPTCGEGKTERGDQSRGDPTIEWVTEILKDPGRLRAVVAESPWDDRWYYKIRLLTPNMPDATPLLTEINTCNRKRHGSCPWLRSCLDWANQRVKVTNQRLPTTAKVAIALLHFFALCGRETSDTAVAIANRFNCPYVPDVASSLAALVKQGYAACEDPERSPHREADRPAPISRKNSNTYPPPNAMLGTFISYAITRLGGLESMGVLEVDVNLLVHWLRQLKDLHCQSAIQKQHIDTLVTLWREMLHLTPIHLNRSPSEWDTLDAYLRAIRLIVDCKDAAIGVDAAIWEHLSERLLVDRTTSA